MDLTTRIVRNKAGEEVTAQGPILFPYEPSFDDKLRIDGVDRAIIAFKPARSLGNATHYKPPTAVGGDSANGSSW